MRVLTRPPLRVLPSLKNRGIPQLDPTRASALPGGIAPGGSGRVGRLLRLAIRLAVPIRIRLAVPAHRPRRGARRHERPRARKRTARPASATSQCRSIVAPACSLSSRHGPPTDLKVSVSMADSVRPYHHLERTSGRCPAAGHMRRWADSRDITRRARIGTRWGKPASGAPLLRNELLLLHVGQRTTTRAGGSDGACADAHRPSDPPLLGFRCSARLGDRDRNHRGAHARDDAGDEMAIGGLDRVRRRLDGLRMDLVGIRNLTLLFSSELENSPTIPKQPCAPLPRPPLPCDVRRARAKVTSRDDLRRLSECARKRRSCGIVPT